MSLMKWTGQASRRLAVILFAGIVPLCAVAGARAETQPIAALTELTGNFSRFGEDCRRGYEIALAASTDAPKVLFGDHQSDPKVGLSEFHRLVDVERANLVVSSRSPVVLALNPLSVKQGIPLIGVISHPRFVKENANAVRIFPSSVDEASALAAYAMAQGDRKIATISLEDEFFLGLRDEFEVRVGKDKIVFSETVAPTEQDFASLLLRVKAKSPDAIFANVGPAQMTQLVQKIRQAGLNVRLYSNFVAGTEDTRKALGSGAEGIVFAEVVFEKPGYLKAVAAVSKNSFLSPLGYSCYVAMNYALQLEQVAQSRQISLGDSIAMVREVPTFDGPISIVDREAKFEVVAKTIRNGAVERALGSGQ
ncbi:MAG: ABC transporter substrate-binding protein [Deltaproteobacteria bacterium]|nr:ABC transporter substrate-binding protein [Deltaproteobacteria bacterium]